MANKIGFVGGGNMAEGIIRGMMNSGKFKPEDVSVYDIIKDRVKYLSDTYSLVAGTDVNSVVKDADLVIFAVRPQDAANVCPEINAAIGKGKVFATICAGLKLESYLEWFDADQKIVRFMPNTLTETKHGYSAICSNANTEKNDLELITLVLESIGQVMEIKENMFDSFTAYSCAGPCYILELASAMIDAGVRAGFSRKDSRAMTLENLIGTSMKVSQTGKHPLEVVDLMTSPAGVTIEAVYTMNKSGLYASVMESIGVAVEKSNQLG